MRTLDIAQFDIRLHDISDGAGNDVSPRFRVAFELLQAAFPDKELAKKMLPYSGDVLLSYMEQPNKSKAITTCYATLKGDFEEACIALDRTYNTSDSKRIEAALKAAYDSAILTLEEIQLSENPKHTLPSAPLKISPSAPSAPSVKKGVLDIALFEKEKIQAQKTLQKQKELTNLLDILATDENVTWREMASDTNAQYVLVHQPIEYIGLWRVSGKRVLLLTDCFIEVTQQISPILTSKSSDYTHVFRLRDRAGKEHEIVVPMKHRMDGTFASKLKAIGRYPTTKTNQQYFDEALDLLSRRDTVIQQQQTDTLGWNNTPDGTRVYVLTNGCETLEGFLEGNLAPFIAPSLPDNANGYKGANVPAPSDEVMELLLHHLNPNVIDIEAALLGIAAYVMFPETPHKGTLRFVTEIIGASRRGKSAMINFFLSLFGVNFPFDGATQLNIDAALGKGNTSLGDLGIMSLAKYAMYSDADYKVNSSQAEMDKQRARRDGMNMMVADNASGGVTSSRNGKLRFRDNPYGAMLRQGNYDFALTKMDEAHEARVNTFIWNDNAISKEAISESIEAQRIGIYAHGKAYRMWIASKSDEALQALYVTAYREAGTIVNSHNWYRDLHKEYTRIMITGLLLWQAWLMEQYTSSFMIEWINNHIPDLVTSRLARNKFIFEDMQASENKELATIILDAIRDVLHLGIGHIRQQNNYELDDAFMLANNYQMQVDSLGYKRTLKYISNKPKSVLAPSGVALGYIMPKHEVIAFRASVLETKVYEYLSKKGMKVAIKEIHEVMLTQVYSVHYKNTKIGKSSVVHLSYIPLSVLYPFDIEAIDDDEADENNEGELHPIKITDAPSLRNGNVSHSLTTDDLEVIEPD